MKSQQVFILLVGIALLQVSLALAEGEEATTVPAGAEEANPFSSQEADGAAKRTGTENICEFLDEENKNKPDSNYKCTETYMERTDKRKLSETYGRCIRLLHKDEEGGPEGQQAETCYKNCGGNKACQKKCANDYYRLITHPCGSGAGAIPGINVGVLILIAVAGAGLQQALNFGSIF